MRAAARILLFAALGAIQTQGVPSTALATGLVRVQQNDGTVQVYPNARIRFAKTARSLSITTADGKGTLTIEQAACSYIGQLYRCLLTQMSLTQNGQTNPLDFENGTLYANTTANPIQLPLSTQTVPAKGIVMALKTKIGTYLSVTGTIDSVAK